MKKTITLLMFLCMGITAAVADNLVCEGLTTRPNNNKCTFSNRLEWTNSTGNTMQLFSMSAGDLSDYTTMKLTLSDFIDKRADQSTSNTYIVRVLFIAGSNNYTQHFASTGDKEFNLSSIMSAEQIASITEIAIGGDNGAGSVIVDPASVKLIKSDATELVCEGFVKRASNNNVSYVQNVFAWTASNSNTKTLFSLSEGQLSAYSTLHLTTSALWGTGSKYRVMFLAGSSTILTKTYDAAGTQEINLFSEMTDDQVASITEIVFGGSTSTTGSVVINPSDVYLVETPENLRLEKVITSSSTNSDPFEWHKTDGGSVTIKNNLSTQNSSTIFGYDNNNDVDHGYFDLAGYNKVVLDLATSGTVRILAASGEGTTYSNTFASLGVKNVDISDKDIRKCVSIKAGQGSSNSPQINSITFYREFDATSTTAWDLACDMEETTFDYPRYFTVGRECTVYLPFDLTAEQVSAAGEFYEFVAFDGSNLGFNPVTTTTAYTPYLFVPATNLPFKNITTSLKAVDEHPATFGGATFKGTLAHAADVKGAESGNTVYGYNAANGEFVKVTGTGVSIDAFRAYIVIPGAPLSAPARFHVSINKTPTAIEEVETTKLEGSTKVLRDGQLFILRDGKTYNVQGQIVK